MEVLQLPAALQEVLRYTLSAKTAAADSQQDDNRPRSPQPGRLVQAVYFTRSFVPTYLLAIIAIVLIGCARNYHIRYRRRQYLQHRRDEGTTSPQTPLSDSSTLVDNEVSRLSSRMTTEHTSLLKKHHASFPSPSFSSRLLSRVNAGLIHQPNPIPALTSPLNHLPPNGTSILIVLFLFLNLFYLFYNNEVSVAMAFAFGQRAAALFVANLPVIYLLGAKNNQPLKWLTGWSYEKVNLYHRRLGEWMTILALIHCACMFITFYTIIKPFGYSLSWFVSLPIIATGLAALATYLAIWGTSIGYVRNVAYEFFLASHIVLQFAALVLVFFHHPVSRLFTGLSLVIWLSDRLVSRFYLSNKAFVATLEVAEDKSTVLLYCDIAIDKSKRHDIRSGWKTGQHIFVSVPGMRWYHAAQAHPFTIASPAPAATITDGSIWPLQLTIRCMNGFSKDLLQYAEFHQHAKVYIDGPYGDSDLEDVVLSADRIGLIAGGSGIAVTYPLSWLSWARGNDSTIVSKRTIYHCGRKRTTKVRLHSTLNEQKQAHWWIRQIPQHGSWITMFPALCRASSLSIGTDDYSDGVNLISQTFDTRHDISTTRPDIETEIRTWLNSDEKTTLNQGQRVCLVVSGPDSLVRDVRNTTAALTKEGYNIDLHVEKFGW